MYLVTKSELILSRIKFMVLTNKHLLILLCVLSQLYIFMKILTYYISWFRVLEISFITMIFGLAPAYFLRKILKFENIIGWLVNSSAFGILLIPFLFLVLGWLNQNFIFTHSILFLYVGSFLGIISLFVFPEKGSLRHYINFRGIAKIDFLFYTIIFAYTLILTLLNFGQVYARWDAFTFWGLAAKYIFQFNRLPNSSLDVFSFFSYTSYYPIYYSIIYDLYDSVLEQYASWINVFFNLIGLLLIYNSILKKNILIKSLIITVLIITSFAAIDSVFMFSMYADLLCAFNLLLFMMVLTGDYEYRPETYVARVFILLLLSISFYFIKSPFLYFTFVFLVLITIYDKKILSGNWRLLIVRIDFWLAIVFIALICLMRFNYFISDLKIENPSPYFNTMKLPQNLPPVSLLHYTKEFIPWFIKASPHLIGLWCFGIISIFVFLKKKSFPPREYIFIYFVSIGIFLFFVFAYIIIRKSLLSASIIRYTAIVMYLVPLMFNYVPINFSPRKTRFILIFLFFLSSSYVIKTMTPVPLYAGFNISAGSYSAYINNYSELAENVLKIAGADSKILIAQNSLDNDQFSNMYTPSIYIRYFLMENSVGGQYRKLPMEELYHFALSEKADYILLLSYAKITYSCEYLFTQSHNYLIKVDGFYVFNESTCVFSKNIIIDLGK